MCTFSLQAAKTMKYGSGVEGIHFSILYALSSHDFSEALIFFNFSSGISTVEPEQYARRFLAFIADAIE
jgi:hypothetical protein